MLQDKKRCLLSIRKFVIQACRRVRTVCKFVMISCIDATTEDCYWTTKFCYENTQTCVKTLETGDSKKCYRIMMFVTGFETGANASLHRKFPRKNGDCDWITKRGYQVCYGITKAYVTRSENL